MDNVVAGSFRLSSVDVRSGVNTTGGDLEIQSLKQGEVTNNTKTPRFISH